MNQTRSLWFAVVILAAVVLWQSFALQHAQRTAENAIVQASLAVAELSLVNKWKDDTRGDLKRLENALNVSGGSWKYSAY